jgi:uncharacterized repeat protein (TIGR02543 family)
MSSAVYTKYCTGSAASPVTKNIDHTLFAQWSLVTYDIFYTTNGGTNHVSNPPTYTFETGTIFLQAPSRDGYSFGGWYDNEGLVGTAMTQIGTGSTGTVRLYAKWSVINYAISYSYLHDGTNHPSNPSTYTVATSTITLQPPSRTGYEFGGWFDNASLTGSSISQIPAGSTGNRTLYAKWSGSECTVSFNQTGGSVPDPQSKVVAFGSSYGPLAVTTRPGYDFNGWFTSSSGGTRVLSSTTVNESADHDLYAQWSPATFPVTFNPQSGSTPVPTSKDVTYGTIYGALATTSRTGYIFNGWFTSSSGGTRVYPETTVTQTSAHSVYAQWTGRDYTLSFNSMGGNSISSKVVTFGNTYGTLTSPSKSGYTFKGWYTSSSGGTRILSTSTVATASNHTLYAQWTPKVLTVTFARNGGTPPSFSEKTVTFGTPYGTLPTTSHWSYTFAGWVDPYGNPITAATVVTIPTDHELTPTWE